MNILGISTCSSDAGACLLQDGHIVATILETTLAPGSTPSFPTRAIQHCLDTGTIALEQLDLIAFCDAPAIQAKKIFATALSQAPFAPGAFISQAAAWLQQQVWCKRAVFNLAGFQGRILVAGRHESLAATTFFSSKFQEAALYTMAGSDNSAACAHGQASYHNISILAEQPFPHTLDLMCSAFRHHLGIEQDNGKQFMELAPQGRPEYTRQILSELIDVHRDGSFKLNMRAFRWKNGLRLAATTSKTFPVSAQADIARSLQEVMTMVLSRSLHCLHRETRQNNLCITGGSALGCIDLDALLAQSAFKEYAVQLNESGGAPGAALFAWHHALGTR